MTHIYSCSHRCVKYLHMSPSLSPIYLFCLILPFGLPIYTHIFHIHLCLFSSSQLCKQSMCFSLYLCNLTQSYTYQHMSKNTHTEYTVHWYNISIYIYIGIFYHYFTEKRRKILYILYFIRHCMLLYSTLHIVT